MRGRHRAVAAAALAVVVIALVALAAMLAEIKLRSGLPWRELADDWRRFGYGRSGVLLVANAGMRGLAACTGHADRAVYRDDATIERLAPGASELRRRWLDVRREARAVRLARGRDVHGIFDLADRWDVALLKPHGGDYTALARAAMPVTCRALAAMGVEMAILSRLAPGARLPTHIGPAYSFLRYHLCLEGDGRAELVVDGERYRWREGEHVVFDETRPHSATNDSPAARLVLFADVLRPIGVRGLDSLVRATARATAGWHGWR